MIKLLACSLVALISTNVCGQTADFLLAEKYSSDSLSRYAEHRTVDANWLSPTEFSYKTERAGKPVYLLVDCLTGSRSPLFDSKLLAAKLSEKGFQANESNLLVYSVERDTKDKGSINFLYRGRRFSYNSRTNLLSEIKIAEGKKPTRPAVIIPYWKKYSPDSAWFTYAYRHDLYLQKANETEATRLTNDAAPYYSFISSNSGSTDEKKYSPVVYWMKDSKKIFALREDKREVGEMAVINSLASPRPELTSYKFPLPGDKEVVKYELFLFDVSSRKGRRINISKYPDQKIILQGSLVNGRMVLFAGNITDNDKYVYFLRRSRTNDQMDLCRLNVADGKIDELISETCKPHFNDQLFSCRILNGGNDILWWSERTGYGQYYLYDRNGKLKSREAKGKFVAGDIHSIDTLKRSFVFEGYGREKGIDPYYRMFYRINFDGSGLTLLTPGNGYHDLVTSRRSDYLLDTYSRMDMPPVTVLRNKDGRPVMELEKDGVTMLQQQGWKAPRLLKVKAADGKTDLYGVMYLPFNMDSTKKYPVITNVYPGPQDDFIPRKFTIDDNYNQSLAQLGFIVINVAPRGSSPLRGRDFHCFGYGNLRDYALADDKYVLEQLALRYPYIDLSRVGIYGHSGGGFMSATAILTYPDFYKVAVAASGNYDPNIYTQWWGETYHGVWLKEKGFESNISTTAELAGNLKGRLLLITGDMDKNVHMASTLRLADALIKKNKRFDMMVLPGKDHGLGDKYYINLIRYYFTENLLMKKSADSDIVTHQ